MKPSLLWLACIAAVSPAFGQDLGLDLSESAAVKSVLVMPPIVKVVQSQGAFSGFNAAKTYEKFDAAAHKRLVGAFQKELEGKVIPAETAFGLLAKEAITPAAVRTPGGVQKLAKATNVAYVVLFDFNKTGAFTGTIYDEQGAVVGQPSYVTNAKEMTQKNCDDMASYVSKELIALAKAKTDAAQKLADAAAAKAAAEEAAAKAREPQTVAPPTDDLEREVARSTKRASTGYQPDRNRVRAFVSVGPGASLRTLTLGGEVASQLADLKSNAVVGLSVSAQVSPLKFFEKLASSRFSDLDVDFHYRRAFSLATGQAGGLEGQSCRMNEDEVMVRGTYRVKVANGTYAPTVGVAGAWTQEQTVFTCTFPLLSASYRGADAQLRLKQPVYKDLLALDVAFGPRFLFSQPGLTPGFSLAGEGWLELKPYSVLFARAGGRVSNLVVTGTGLTVNDTRMFFGAEVGAFF